jgi:malate synthase
MEDAATVEISRALLWQWVQREATMADGRPVSAALVRSVLADEADRLRISDRSDSRRAIDRAAGLLDQLVTGEEFPDFFTVPAYELLTLPR